MALPDRSRPPLGIPARRRRLLPFASTFLLVGVGAVMLACSEYPTAPPPPRATAVVDSLGAPPNGPGYAISDNTMQLPPDVPEVWTATLGVPAVGLATRQRVGDVPVGLLLVDVQATGTINGQWLYPCANCNLPPYPAAGRNQGLSCVGYVWIEGSAPGACQGGDISGRMHVADSVIVGRAEGPGIRLYNDLGGQLCGPLNCIGWSGSQTVIIKRLPTDLTLSATLYGTTTPAPSEVWWGTTVMFTTDREVGTAGSAMPIYRFGMKWTPDPTNVPERTSVKTCNPQAASCAPVLYESGTYEAQGYVNGTGKTKQRHVDVRRRKLLLDLKPGQYVKRGTQVTWQGTRDYGVGGTFRDPRWSIDDTTATSKFSCTNYGWICTETALHDFTRTITAIIDDSLQTKDKLVRVYQTFEVRANPKTAKLGDTVVFTAYLDSIPHPAARWVWDGSVPQDECAGRDTCTRVMDVPGSPVMTAYLELQGGDFAAAGVQVQPPSFSVAASQASVMKGDTVTFTARLDGSASVKPSFWRFAADTADTAQTPGCNAGANPCRTVPARSGSMWAGVTIGSWRDSAQAHVAVQCFSDGTPGSAGCLKPSVKIIKAAGRNAEGSFTTRKSEDIFDLEVEVVPSSASASVTWEIKDDPADQVLGGPVSAGSGAKTTATVPLPPDAWDRWPTTMANHPGAMSLKKLRYRVRAQVVVAGATVFSDWATIEQSDVDVIRQEFVEDPRSIQSLIPAASAFLMQVPRYKGVYQTNPLSETGLGDYCVTGSSGCITLVAPQLDEFIRWLQSNWTRKFTPTSIFRNPVHHHRHFKKKPAKNDSPHKYGTAIDLDNPWDSLPRGKLFWVAFRTFGLQYPSGGVCAETWWLKDEFAGDHVHFDRRYETQPRCLDTWKIPQRAERGAARVMATDDSLVTMLSDPDWTVRAAAASVLSELPSAELPAGYGPAALDQLKKEIALRRSGMLAPEEYTAYILELVRVVHHSEDPRAAEALAEMGLESSNGTRRFVARFPEFSMPGLDRAWEDPALRADVIGTYADMLRFEADSGFALTTAHRTRIDRRFAEAATADPIAQWGVAFWSGRHRLVQYQPLLAFMAERPDHPDDPDGFVREAIQEGLAVLNPLLAATPDSALLQHALSMEASLCTEASGQRFGQCTELDRHLRDAQRKLAGGNGKSAAQSLSVYIDQVDRATERGVFTPAERAMLRGLAEEVLRRLR